MLFLTQKLGITFIKSSGNTLRSYFDTQVRNRKDQLLMLKILFLWYFRRVMITSFQEKLLDFYNILGNYNWFVSEKSICPRILVVASLTRKFFFSNSDKYFEEQFYCVFYTQFRLERHLSVSAMRSLVGYVIFSWSYRTRPTDSTNWMTCCHPSMPWRAEDIGSQMSQQAEGGN